jgi:hypothetical protein
MAEVISLEDWKESLEEQKELEELNSDIHAVTMRLSQVLEGQEASVVFGALANVLAFFTAVMVHNGADNPLPALEECARELITLGDVQVVEEDEDDED